MDKEKCEENNWLAENSFMILVMFILLAIILGAVLIY